MFVSNHRKTWLQWPKTWALLNLFRCSWGFIRCKLLWKRLSQKTCVPRWKRMVTIAFLNILLQRGRCTLDHDIKTLKLPRRVACSMYTNVLIHTSPLSSYLVNKETRVALGHHAASCCSPTGRPDPGCISKSHSLCNILICLPVCLPAHLLLLTNQIICRSPHQGWNQIFGFYASAAGQ